MVISSIFPGKQAFTLNWWFVVKGSNKGKYSLFFSFNPNGNTFLLYTPESICLSDCWKSIL